MVHLRYVHKTTRAGSICSKESLRTQTHNTLRSLSRLSIHT